MKTPPLSLWLRLALRPRRSALILQSLETELIYLIYRSFTLSTSTDSCVCILIYHSRWFFRTGKTPFYLSFQLPFLLPRPTSSSRRRCQVLLPLPHPLLRRRIKVVHSKLKLVKIKILFHARYSWTVCVLSAFALYVPHIQDPFKAFLEREFFCGTVFLREILS